MNQGLGEASRRGISLEDLPMGSVVYVGRGAFRMEAVGPDGLIAELDGVVQPVTRIVTAPYGHASGDITRVDLPPEPPISAGPGLASPVGSPGAVPLPPP